jgi:hypothetical protein
MSKKFVNWGRTVENEPAKTVVPKKKQELCELVKWAGANGLTVRASGYRHSWAEIFSADGQVLVSMLKPSLVETIPATEPEIESGNELQGIKLVGTLEEEGVEKALCRIGAATTNEQFRRWCLSPKGGNMKWTVPLNVIMVEITWGGSNAPMCHGAGWRHPTLSDLVTEVEFVNAKGNLQTVSGPTLKAAAGCFGLLGIVTAITLKLDPMSYATLNPEKRPIALTVPPRERSEIPQQLNQGAVTEAELEEARTRFATQCEESYYAEWFWFPYQEEGWANCWKNDGAAERAVEYPGEWEALFQELEEALADLMEESSPFKTEMTGREQAELFGESAMAFMPNGPETVAPLIDALHFRRGLHNFRCVDMELSIPIPARPGAPTEPDWSICQKAWWDAINCVYRQAGAPMRVALEMRVMGGSEMTMAPQFGNQLGTCAIEVLTNIDTPRSEWVDFTREITGLWTSYTDGDGGTLNVRPHWAKDWQELTFNDRSAVEYLRETAYATQIPKFRSELEAIAKAGGYPLAALKMFSNPLFDELFGELFEA